MILKQNILDLVWALLPITGVLITRGEKAERHRGEGHEKMEVEIRVTLYQPRNTWGH